MTPAELLSKSMETYSGRKAILQSVLKSLGAMERMAEAGPPPNFDPGPVASRMVKTRLMRQTLEEIRSVDGPEASVSYTDPSGVDGTATVSRLISKLDWSVSKISEWSGVEEAVVVASVLAT